jgi:putative transposase
LRYVQPDRTNQNAYIERFNESYPNEVLDVHLLEDLDQVREITDTKLQLCNEERPHETLGDLPSSAFREYCERQNF